MKLDRSPDGRLVGVRSEGKLLEVSLIIETPEGSAFMLPPVIYEIDNWLAGYRDDHTIGRPWTYYSNEKIVLPGSGYGGSRVSFLIRLIEKGTPPVPAPTIDAAAVREIVAALAAK